LAIISAYDEAQNVGRAGEELALVRADPAKAARKLGFTARHGLDDRRGGSWRWQRRNAASRG
jgi:UDP-glucose 4-epimerase